MGNLPGGVANGEPLLIVALWAGAEVFGGTRAAVGHVMSWYPVVSAGLTAVMLYLLGVKISGDQRVGIASVALLGVLPGHAMRTSLGFADHHAFDYIWLALVVLSMAVLIASAHRSDQTILGVCGLGVGVAGQTLAWDASVLLLIPVGLTIAVLSIQPFIIVDRQPER
ncbi:STT3 domain-containing protein [Halosegnis marinus]|uniref:STT3 domain-containing protein n=1 Tax=Halosegnis marinus TaxID=3034023 RepID=UPI00362052F8